MGVSSKKSALVQKDLCVACGCCVNVCPLQAIHIQRGSYAQVDQQRCVGCGKCAGECPATVISIIDRRNADEKAVV